MGFARGGLNDTVEHHVARAKFVVATSSAEAKFAMLNNM